MSSFLSLYLPLSFPVKDLDLYMISIYHLNHTLLRDIQSCHLPYPWVFKRVFTWFTPQIQLKVENGKYVDTCLGIGESHFQPPLKSGGSGNIHPQNQVKDDDSVLTY